MTYKDCKKRKTNNYGMKFSALHYSRGQILCWSDPYVIISLSLFSFKCEFISSCYLTLEQPRVNDLKPLLAKNIRPPFRLVQGWEIANKRVKKSPVGYSDLTEDNQSRNSGWAPSWDCGKSHHLCYQGPCWIRPVHGLAPCLCSAAQNGQESLICMQEPWAS